MAKDTPDPSDPLSGFLEQYWKDRDAGRIRPLADYLVMFPGDDIGIAREYVAIQENTVRIPERAQRRSADAASGKPPSLGPFRLLRELGRGGQGVVHLAEDTRMDRLVALKTFPLLPPYDESVLGHMRREAQAAARLDHPGICPVYSIGEDRGYAWIAMKYVEGETLAGRISRQRQATTKDETVHVDLASTTNPETPSGAPMPPAPEEVIAPCPIDLPAIRAAAALIESAARILHVAHEAGIVHRDIKPSNIAVTAGDRPVILDFGLARRIGSDETSLAPTGHAIGTPGYMSPEQVKGERSLVDRRTDVYALGVTLFESLTLRRPFQSESRDALFHQIINDEPRDPGTLNPAIPADLSAVIGACLRKDRGSRYPTALALAEDLRRWLAGAAIRGPELEPAAPAGAPPATPSVETASTPTTPDARPEALPERIGPYRILGLLRQGGLGVVYLAQDLKLNRRVALKTTRPLDATNWETWVDMYRSEAEVLARLDHPGVCRVYDCGIDRDLCWTAMQRIEGLTLQRLIAEAQAEGGGKPHETAGVAGWWTPSEPRGTWTVVLSLVEKVARALQVVHGTGIVHGNVKPGSIMLTPEGEPVLISFGVARHEGRNRPPIKAGDFVGTPAYMAPEHLSSGVMPVDSRTDIYALGVTLYECLTLRRPFEAPTREALFDAILNQRPPDPRLRCPWIAPEVCSILDRSQAKDPDSRYQTAGAMADAIASVLTRLGRPVARPVPTAPGDLRSGDVFAGHRIHERLGRGRSGSVYLATSENLRRDVALKVLDPITGVAPDDMWQFLRNEAAALAKVDDPAICPIYDVGQEAGRFYIAMRHVPGTTLASRIHAAGDAAAATDPPGIPALPLRTTLDVIESLAKGLHAAHEAGVVHGDVRSANIIVQPDGHPVLVDFGAAFPVSESRSEADEPITVTFHPPLAPCPPDALGNQGQRIQADVFALGAVLYQCLAGQAPFDDHRLGAWRILEAGGPPDIRVFHPEAPAEVAALLKRAFHRKPARRFQTALQLAEALMMVRGRSRQERDGRRDRDAGGRAETGRGERGRRDSDVTPPPFWRRLLGRIFGRR